MVVQFKPATGRKEGKLGWETFAYRYLLLFLPLGQFEMTCLTNQGWQIRKSLSRPLLLGHFPTDLMEHLEMG
jgi:hypothetical protein